MQPHWPDLTRCLSNEAISECAVTYSDPPYPLKLVRDQYDSTYIRIQLADLH